MTAVSNSGKSTGNLALEAFLPYRLNRLADVVSRKFAKIYKDRYGLTRPEWRTLATLGQFGSLTSTEIVNHSAMHKTRVSRAVSALERRHWLKRSTDADDRRVEHLVLSRAGDKVYRDLVPLAEDFEMQVYGNLGKRDAAAVKAGLEVLERQLGLTG